MDNALVALLAEIGAWVAALALIGVAVVEGGRDARRARARRRSVVDGREVRYGSATSYRPRSGLWSGLLFVWVGSNIAAVLLFVGLFPPEWRATATTAIVVLVVLAYLVALRFLLDYARTEVVEGRVLERRILYSGEDDATKHHWIAVDDGRPGRIAGTPVSPADYARVVAGARIRLHRTPRGRRVKRLEVLELPRSANASAGEAACLITPAQAARALGSPVEFVPVASDVPNTRRCVYVPPGTRVTNGTVPSPALHVTEAFDPDAANEIARRATAGGKRAWHHGNRGVFQTGMTYILTWGNGALLLRGQVDVADVGEVSRLAHSLNPPGPDPP
ncbi:hypothetical protein GCM10020369_07550 [Cryptosporangium minutisporangium]|uniref:DUF58 domain-containing protein n=1 Tax=Cryptosporangium minutisporangium TaxID=113569 RepID=A0ABP6SSM9_9ACTN